MSLQNNTNPFVGLRPFESDEGLLFFGRQEQTMDLLQRLHEHHFVAIIGNSGCGKSSLIRGGLIPRLKAGYLVDDLDRWMIAMMKPGRSPLHNLADVILTQLNRENDNQSVVNLVKKIKDEGSDVLLDILKPLWEQHNTNFFLLVDQFEELFRFSMDQKEIENKDDAIDFVNIMLQLSRQKDLPIYIVMTMRSDFIGDCAQFFGLPEAMNQSQYLVPRLNRAQLKTAIEGPVKLYGGIINPALTSRLLNDVAALKDELPLLQHALMRIWEHEINIDKSGELNLNDYESIGRIEMALSKHADEALEGMSEKELELTKKIFQVLTVVDENGRKIRRSARLNELQAITGEDKERLMAIINRFIEKNRSFLIVTKVGHTNEEVIDISHESLIRQWNTLNAWVDEESESSKVYMRLKESAELCRDKKKDLLKGSEFQIAMQWYKKVNPSVSWAQRYDNSYEESIQYLLESEKDLKLSERKSKTIKRNKTILLFSSAILLLVAAFFFILNSRSQLQRQREMAIKEAFRLNSLAQDWVDIDPTIALRIEDAALKKSPDSVIRKISQQIYVKNAFYKIIIKDTSLISSVAFSPDGSKILTGSYNRITKLWNLDGNLVKEFKGHTGNIYSAVFSPDGTKVLTASGDHTARLWSIDGSFITEFKGHIDSISQAVFSPDGTKVFTGSMDGTAILWNLDGSVFTKFIRQADAIKSVAFSPDGTKVLTGCYDKVARLWNLDGSLVKEFKGHKEGIASVAFSPDGTKIFTGSFDWTARLWDINGTELKKFEGHKDAVKSVAFSPDGTKVLTASFDRTARLWDLNGILLKEFKGHTDQIKSAAFSPDGSKIITAGSDDKTVRLWDIDDHVLKEFKGYTHSVNAVSFSPDGTRVFTGCIDKVARLWNLNGSLIKEFKIPADSILSIAFSPDGTKVLTGCIDKVARLWNLDGSLLKEFKGHTGSVYSVSFSPDGTRVLTGSDDQTARLWDIDGSFLKAFNGHTNSVVAVAFSPDGTRVLTGSLDWTARLWNIDGSFLKEFKGHNFHVTSVAFSPDGTKILTGSADHVARLWSIDGQLLREFRGHSDSIFSIAFSPDGTEILTCSEDRTVRLWNLNSDLLAVLQGHSNSVLTVAFSPDGTKILTGSADHTARLWNNIITTLETFLKSDKINKLTEEQEKVLGITK